MLLLGLLAGFFLRGRRKDTVVVANPAPQAAAPAVARPVVVAAAVQAEPVAPVAAVAAAPLMPRATSFSSDALEGANIYIAYGRFGEARNALRKAIEHEPARLDLRLRLLEVLGELGDASGFASEELRARELGANPVQIEQIRALQPCATSSRAAGRCRAATRRTCRFRYAAANRRLPAQPRRPVAGCRLGSGQPVQTGRAGTWQGHHAAVF